MKLTIKQQRFADEYIISGNATDAYLKAYAKQSKASADANARKLLGNYSVKNYINERLKEIEDKSIAKQEEVLKFLTSVLRGEQTEEVLYGMGEGTQGKTRLELSGKDRIKA
ncbi:terminase small subunit, partial [Helcococcus bovis]|uniref:terminase small subunit n=1 Tax=Helcococcus bovis TaxID=3153252 RepID=UPI0038B6F8B7